MSRPAVNIAVRAARAASHVILRQMNRVDGLATVEDRQLNFVSEVSRSAQAEIIRELRRSFPGHALLGEGLPAPSEARHAWAINGLDGIHNYMRGLPQFCVSMALLENGLPTAAVVYDPLRDEVFTASKGGGAYLNDRRIRVSQRETLNGTMLATSLHFQQREYLGDQLAMMRALLDEAQDMRQSGSTVLDLADVAAGRIDGFLALGLQPWEYAAGCLLVREAGGSHVDLVGRDGMPRDGHLVAGTVRVTQAMITAIAPHIPAALKR